MNTLILAFLAALAKAVAHALSYEPQNAGAYQQYFTEQLTAAQAAQTGKAGVTDFIADGLSLAQTGTAAFGTPAEQALSGAIAKAVTDAEQGKWLNEVGDALAVYKDGKAVV